MHHAIHARSLPPFSSRFRSLGGNTLNYFILSFVPSHHPTILVTFRRYTLSAESHWLLAVRVATLSQEPDILSLRLSSSASSRWFSYPRGICHHLSFSPFLSHIFLLPGCSYTKLSRRNGRSSTSVSG